MEEAEQIPLTDDGQVNGLLTELMKWGKENHRGEFCTFFRETIVRAKAEFDKSKKKAWSKYLNAITVIAIAATPILFTLINCLLQNSSMANRLWVLFAASLVYFPLAFWLQWHNMKKSKETWVRRSARYYRLSIALGRFLFSDRKEADYREFVQDTFAILDQNLDQFVLNLSSNGLAGKGKR